MLVTFSTVGYGDVSPKSHSGKVASMHAMHTMHAHHAHTMRTLCA